MRDMSARVAVVGSGPAGFYACGHMLRAKDVSIQVDLFDRLPTPFGLVRAGVAPDHPKIKSVTKVYDKTAADPAFRFFGNVDIGRDLTHQELTQHYDAVIYAHGTGADRTMGIPGEDLPGPAHEDLEQGEPFARDLDLGLAAPDLARGRVDAQRPDL